MKKIIFAVYLVLCLAACGKSDTRDSDEKSAVTAAPAAETALEFDGKEYSYKRDALPAACISENEIICAIENVVKCALNPKASYCDAKTMPDFIFYDDAMFADDDGLGRPTTQSFRPVKMKPINADTIEVLTTGTCDKNWFGNCAGNIIYILDNKSGHWRVKELYAIENI